MPRMAEVLQEAIWETVLKATEKVKQVSFLMPAKV